MHKLFNNILLPVDVTREFEQPLERAVLFARQFNCDVHLLYPSGRSFWPGADKSKNAVRKFQLHQLRDKFASMLPNGCVLHAACSEEKPEKAIAAYVAVNRIDLVIAHRHGDLFATLKAGININRLSARTGCPVLSLQSGPSLNDIKNIVLPVGDHLPLKKMMLAIYLANQSNAAIHLISVSTRPGSRGNMYLEKTYQLLRENTRYPIKCMSMEGENVADTTLEYARTVEADLILVNPGNESLLSGPLNRLFAKFLFNRSNIPVLTVA